MKYTKIVNEQEIAEAQNILSRINRVGEKFEVKKINNISGHSVYWFDALGFWINTELLVNTKGSSVEKYFWNPCGISKPQHVNDKLDITVQIGIEPSGERNRAGVFLKDDLGNIYLAHSGKVNKGERSKIPDGKQKIREYILKNIDRQQFDIEKYMSSQEVIIIGCLSSKDFIEHLAFYVHEIARLKRDYRTYLGIKN